VLDWTSVAELRIHPDHKARVDRLLRSELRSVHAQTDRLFAVLMALQWVGAIVAASVIAPRAWDGASSRMHEHILIAVIFGGLLAIPTITLSLMRPGERLTRNANAVAQVLFSTLLVHLTGGRIETHFHVFVSLAFIALYREWSLLIAPTLVVVVDHLLRSVFWPQSVFGVLTPAPWRAIEHGGWVLFEDIVLGYSCIRSVAQMRSTCETQIRLAEAQESTEAVVIERTKDLEAARAQAEAASEAKSQFLANMSHEIRTPMTAILGYTELLGEDDASMQGDNRLMAIRSIDTNARHLLSVINDILDVSKIEAGRHGVDRVAMDPAQVIDQVMTQLHHRAVDKGISLNAEFQTPIPVSIHSDPTRVRQILLNLVGNAIKFTEKGGVTIRVTCDPASRLLHLAVADTGIGMTPEQVEKIAGFEAFMQADHSMSRRFGGTGLGLRISNAFAQLLGRGIRIESEPGRGSVFTVTLDTGDLSGITMRQSEKVVLEGASLQPATKVEQAAGISLHGLRILLAEDGPANQKLIVFHLEKAGARVTVASNGREAIERFREAQGATPFDLVLMDMQMPDMDGYEATRHIRADGTDVPILALTAHAMTGDRAKCLSAGCSDYLTKPIDKLTLLRAVRQYAPGSHDKLHDAA